MSMTKAQITTLVQLIAHSLGDSSTLAIAYDETLQALADLNNPPLMSTSTFNITANTSNYSYPADAISIEAVFHQSTELNPVSVRELDAYEKSWRDDTGTPSTFMTDETTADEIRLYPTPDTDHANGGTWFYTENRTSNVPEYLCFYIVFSMLTREFSYPSDHQDKNFAKLCSQIARLFQQFLRLGE